MFIGGKRNQFGVLIMFMVMSFPVCCAEVGGAVSGISDKERRQWLDKLPSFRDGPRCRVGALNGAPAVFIDGKASGPMFYTPPYPYKYDTNGKHIEELAESGINIYFIPASLWNSLSGKSAAEYYDKRLPAVLDAIIKANPDARFFLRVGFPLSLDFIRKYPDELMRFNNGKVDLYKNSSVASCKGRYTFASRIWERHYARTLVSLMEYIRNSRYRSRIIGYFITAGAYGQWMYWFDFDKNKFVYDYSRPMTEYFRKYLREKYNGNIEKLREKWNDREVTFQTAAIPSIEQREGATGWCLKEYDFSYFWDPRKSARVVDYYAALNEVVADRIIYLAEVVKKYTGNNALTGFFYGAIDCCDYVEGGQSGLKRILRSSAVDFMSQPTSYINRNPGNCPPLSSPLASLNLHNKLWINESDTRTCFSDARQRRTTGAPADIEGTLSLLKRDFSQILIAGANGWWFEMRPGWYENSAILKLFKRMQAIGTTSLSFSRGSSSEIAVVVSEDSMFYCSRFLTKVPVEYQRYELNHLGAPCDVFEIGDIAAADMSRYKLVIFLNAYKIGGRERRIIHDRLKKDNKVILWLYGSGLINDSTLSPDNMHELVGMDFSVLPGQHKLEMTVNNKKHPVCSGLGGKNLPSNFNRPIVSDGLGATPARAKKTTPISVDPLVYVRSREVECLAKYDEVGKTSLALKRFPGWTSIYAGTFFLEAKILRAIAEYAGVHIYSGNDDIIFCNQSFLMLHAAAAGVKYVSLPSSRNIIDAFTGRQVAVEDKKFKLECGKGDTHLFFTGNSEQCLKFKTEINTGKNN
ncbi:MAG: hypothetical protein PHV82_10935 [Victivallaceae bacterium]|nr:hypothetical protein [Victivallaceae bacterium]